MTTYDPGDVVLVQFPFTDLTSTKKRPALVVSPRNYASVFGDVVVIALTSQPASDPQGRLKHWQAAGLPRPTWIKPLIATLASSTLLRRVGSIHADDRAAVLQAIRTMIDAEFQAASG